MKTQKINHFRLQRTLVPAVLLISLMWYAGVQGYSAMRGPSLKILTPKNNARINGEAVTLTGLVSLSSKVSINNVPTAVSDSGEFSATVAITPGQVAKFKVTAEDRHGRKKHQELLLVSDYPRSEELIITKNYN